MVIIKGKGGDFFPFFIYAIVHEFHFRQKNLVARKEAKAKDEAKV
jgi:hypothetical protein